MGGFGGGGGGQNQAPLAEAGDYNVVLSHEDISHERTLAVTRTGALSGNSSPFYTGTLEDFVTWMERQARNRR